MLHTFNNSDLAKLYKPAFKSSGEENGQVTIIGGSKLFHGAPLLSLKVASRIVDMVFFASPEPGVGGVAEKLKSKLLSFIWVPWEEVDKYIEKSDAVLIGPGMMRYRSEKREVTGDKKDERVNKKNLSLITYHLSQNNKLDREGKKTREITKSLLKRFPNKRWVIDAGSLQVIDPELLPKGCIITPNEKEFNMLFKFKITNQNLKLVKKLAEKYKCNILLKSSETIVCSPDRCMKIPGGNPGLTKGGTGDVLAGLTVALLAKNDPFLAACAASYISKKAADELYKKVGTHYNSDDLAEIIPESLKSML